MLLRVTDLKADNTVGKAPKGQL